MTTLEQAQSLAQMGTDFYAANKDWVTPAATLAGGLLTPEKVRGCLYAALGAAWAFAVFLTMTPFRLAARAFKRTRLEDEPQEFQALVAKVLSEAEVADGTDDTLQFGSVKVRGGVVTTLLVDGAEASRMRVPLTWAQSRMVKEAYKRRLPDRLRFRKECLWLAASQGEATRKPPEQKAAWSAKVIHVNGGNG